MGKLEPSPFKYHARKVLQELRLTWFVAPESTTRVRVTSKVRYLRDRGVFLRDLRTFEDLFL